jgi:N-acetylmuramoyl-L-alanine amidase
MRYIKYVLTGMVALFVMAGCGGPNRSDSLVVIDAGHGGHDCGAQCGGKQEKELVLQITQRLAKEFKRKGYRVYLTRGNDKFLKLGERTRIADKMDAKVFISIHANAIADKNRFEVVEGIETYYLQKTRDARSQRVAARENASVLQGADALSKDVIIDSVLNGPKIVESNKLALDVQRGMVSQIKRKYPDARDGGAKPAPFYVLVGASRPSILVEVGYITNSKERKRLFSSDYQKRITKGIVEGVSRYLDNRKADIGV